MAPSSSDPTYTTPWWLGGEEVCEVCLQPYVHEAEVRCDNCDGPHCPLCECSSCDPDEDDGTEEGS